MISPGQTAPSFSIADQDGQLVSLSDFRNKKNVVLYFYPKDDTSGCTLEASQFTALKEQFDKADTVILGVSKDDQSSHCNFIKKFDLNVSLLADTEGTLCESYDVWQEKGTAEAPKMGIVRSTFIIDKSGIIRSALYKVSADGHAQEILDFINKTL
ncbi:MAG: peroxiredoxin [Gammaproteobacteria bacterium]|nr:peroxiredoxin [Gammaproteobacteria bacterium]